MHQLDAAAVTAWSAACVRALRELREDIDRINVYPVADSDTGSNMLYTVEGANAAVEGAATEHAAEALRLMAKGAVGAARGNSGMLLSQFFRGLAVAADGAPALDATKLQEALASATEHAGRAVAQPVEGTLLTVLRAASEAADGADPQLEAVVRAASEAAAEALAETPNQLEVLAEAGVVDAGGRGLLAVLDELEATITARPAQRRPALTTPSKSSKTEPSEPNAPEWEVMYDLPALDDAAARALSTALTGIGDCVTIAGDGERHVIHVHCADIGAALEAGLAHGRPQSVRVEALPAQPTPQAPTGRALIAIVDTDDLTSVLSSEGITVVTVPPGQAADQHELDRVIDSQAAAHITVLSASAELTAAALEAADNAVAAGRDVVVIPCAAGVQVLAAVAVHDSSRRAADDVVAMAEAAAATRRGRLEVAAEDAITWIGKVYAGDLIGFSDNEVVLIEPANSAKRPSEVAVELLRRMLVAGGELVTAITGAEAGDATVTELEEQLEREHPEIDVVSYRGTQDGVVVTFGVE